MTIIEDTLTSGDTLRNIIEQIENESGAKVKNVLVSVDRMEKMQHFLGTARDNLEKEYEVKIFSIVTLDDIIGAMQRGVISQEYLSDLIRYKEAYGGSGLR